MTRFRAYLSPVATAGRRAVLLDYGGLILSLAALIALFGVVSRHFLTWRTFSTVANQIPDLTVIAVGMTFVLIVSGIDLSVGSVLALSSVMVAVSMVHWGNPLWMAVVLALGTGTMCGCVSGFISVSWSIPSFIVTLGMLELARGAAYLLADSQTIYVGKAIQTVGTPWLGLGLSPAFLVSVATVVVGQIVLSHTVLGRYMLAIGANEQAARYSGINPRPVKIVVFGIQGFLAGMAGVFYTSRLEAADPNAAIGMELAAIAAVVIGGTSLMGGRGSVVRSYLGVLIIAVLQSGLAHVGATEPTKRIVTGAVIVAAVIVDAQRRR